MFDKNPRREEGSILAHSLRIAVIMSGKADDELPSSLDQTLISKVTLNPSRGMLLFNHYKHFQVCLPVFLNFKKDNVQNLV